jgi:uncharacterized protein YecT (DUF1311 family)
MRSAAAALTLTLIASPALAGTYWHPDPASVCNQQSTTVTIMTCLEGRTKLWDARLNQAYKALNTMLQAQSATAQLADLKKAQRLWVQYRNANCAFYGDAEGTIRETQGAGCLDQMTQDRAIELQLAGPEG